MDKCTYVTRYLKHADYQSCMPRVSSRQEGNEKYKFERPDASNAPVWNLQWCPSRDEESLLAIVDWGQKLTFYEGTAAKQVDCVALGLLVSRCRFHPSDRERTGAGLRPVRAQLADQGPTETRITR
jgi:hypothetical protein